MSQIFIVDDEPGIRESLAEFFQDESFTVATASNGAEALAYLAAADPLPCLMILDLLMPIVNGIEVYTRMQGDARWAAIPVIVSTSDPSRAPSGVLIMKKPINLERLMAIVRQHCDPLNTRPASTKG